MRALVGWLIYKNNRPHLSNERYQKVHRSLIDYVYTQTYVGMIASLFCALVIFIGLYDTQQSNDRLYLWSGFFLIVTFFRIILAYLYKHARYSYRSIKTWYNLYIFGTLLGGISWGLISILLLPNVSLLQQMLIILILAGVTAGAISLSAAIPSSAILFLLSALVPLIFTLALLKSSTFLLFDFALTIYLIYTIILTMKTYRLIKSSTILQFENDLLLNNFEIINKKLKHAATHDPLTQVANRRLFELNLSKAITKASVSKKLFALFYIDLDNFKSVNDIHGHHAGDNILLITIERLRNHFRKNDIIARLGGDELAIIIENMTSRDEIEIIAQKICKLIAEPIKINNISLEISASIGISVYPNDGKNEEALLRCADKCMYFAKDQGGNNFYFSDELKEPV